MARLLLYRAFAKFSLFSLIVCFGLSILGCISDSGAAFAKNDLWSGCRGSDPDGRIASCSQLIARGHRETKANQITAYTKRGVAYRAKGDFDRALADLDKALRLDPKSALALTERASIFYSKGEFDRAIADYDATVSAQSKSAAAFYGRAEAYRAKNDLDRAIADYDEAIRIDPNSANAFLGRANAYRGKHALEGAKQDLEAALRLDPQLAAANDALDEVNRLIAESATKNAAPPTVEAPTPPLAPSPAPAVSPMLLVLLALVTLLGLLAIIITNLRSKPVDKSRLAGTNQHARPRDGYLAEISRLQPSDACARADSGLEGLSQTEADARLKKFGLNLVAREGKANILQELWGRARNPLNALLLTLATVSYFTGDVRAAVVIASMVVLSITTAFIQEHKSNEAAAKLRAMVHTTASVRRTPCDADNPFSEIPIEKLVPGDVVRLSAGDIIPAELRLLEARDLFVNQSTLTGEAMPAEKYAHARDGDCDDPFDLQNICFMGANVVSGYGTGVILRTGPKTFFGQLARQIAGRRVPTAFDQGVTRFTWLMIGFMLVMVPTVFLINGLTKHDWLEALLFAVAVAVGLTPEMLPMIVTVNLAKGAMAMSRKKVIVKRLNAIQNFGAMNVLCTDKTGTLTQDRIILARHLDIRGDNSDHVLEYAYLNSISSRASRTCWIWRSSNTSRCEERYGRRPVQEDRRDAFRFRAPPISSLSGAGTGAYPDLQGRGGGGFPARSALRSRQRDPAPSTIPTSTTRRRDRRLNADGFRVVAVAYKEMPPEQAAYSVGDEADLTLLGYIAFLDPPKESAAAAIAAPRRGVQVKILTGDNDIVTRKICHEVALEVDRIVLGYEIEHIATTRWRNSPRRTIVFAKVSPSQKATIIDALHRKGHVVGYLGDGINDGPALKAADVGISVDTAVDIAKESADIILLEKSLPVLDDGVIEGRKVFGNITKYIKMGASSNFGNMFSVLGASIFLPFLPMAPIQVLTNNLLYDFSQTAIPTDNVDAEYLVPPRKWDIGNILKFMMLIGPISSIFDYVTYFMMLYGFNAWTNPSLFQTGWFVESLLTQTLIIHIIRTARIPFLESRASPSLIATTIIICAVGIALPYTWVGSVLGFTPLPTLYWPLVTATLLTYAILTHLVKVWFIRRWGL